MFHMKPWLGAPAPLIISLNLKTLLELAAGGIDVVAARIADRGFHAASDETALEIFDLMDR